MEDKVNDYQARQRDFKDAQSDDEAKRIMNQE